MISKGDLVQLIINYSNNKNLGETIAKLSDAITEIYKPETFNLNREDFESVLAFLEESEIDYLNVNNKYYAEKYDKFRSYLRDKYGHEWND